MESDLVAVGVDKGECPTEGAVDLETSLGYLLKEASSALRVAMEEVLRPLGMSVMLQALEGDGYVTRHAEAPVGKVLPARLTPRGRRSLEKATAAVRSVEVRMLAGMAGTEQSNAFRILQRMIRSLRDGNVGA